MYRKLGFTGSTEIGHTIMQSCASSNLKKCSLELGKRQRRATMSSLHLENHKMFSFLIARLSLHFLGGKSPLIIFADCDMEKVKTLVLPRKQCKIGALMFYPWLFCRFMVVLPTCGLSTPRIVQHG